MREVNLHRGSDDILLLLDAGLVSDADASDVPNGDIAPTRLAEERLTTRTRHDRRGFDRIRSQRPSLLRTIATLIAGCMFLAACGTGSDFDADEAPTDEIVLDCEELGFPCSWDGVSEDLVRRSAELLLQAGQALDLGEDPEDVAEQLRTESDVVAVVADDTGVQLRVEGAPPVVAFHPFTHPVVSAIRSVVLGDVDVPAESTIVEHASSSATALALGVVPTPGRLAPLAAMTLQSSLDAIAAVPFFGDVSPYEPARDPGIHPRSALAIRPWDDVDAVKLFDDLESAGRLPSGVESPEDLDLDLVGFGSTAAVLADSNDITLQRAADDSAFSEFALHDIVYLQTHSSTFSAGCDPEVGHLCGLVLGGFPIAPEHGPNVDELVAARFQADIGLPPGATIGLINDWWTVGYLPDFFRQAYGSGSLDSIIILNACASAGVGETSFSALASAASGSAGPAVFGWTDFINAIHADRSTAVLVDLLANDALSADEAFRAIDEVPSLRQHLTSGVDGVPDRPRLAFDGRNMRARDAVEVREDGFRMEPGALLIVEGDPNDGEDDKLERMVLRIDGVIDGEQDDATLTWQLAGRHREPLEIENPFEAREGHQVRELEPEPPPGGPGIDTDRWKSYEITMTQLDLEFDVRRSELTGPIDFQLRVELRTGDGSKPSRHEVTSVFLRQGMLEILEPELGRPLQSNDEVVIEGSPDDGMPESYPLVVTLDNLDDSKVRDLELVVTIEDTEVSIPGSQWTRVEQGRYRVERSVELFDFQDREVPVGITATVVLSRDRTIEDSAEPVFLQLVHPSGCDYLSGLDMSAVMGRSFGSVEASSIFGDDDLCSWEGEYSTVVIGLSGRSTVDQLRRAVEQGDPTSIDGFNGAALYDLESGRALEPSSIETDGVVQYNNFVNLSVVIDDSTAVLIQVLGNIVIEEGPESGLLERLRALVEELRGS